MVKLALQCMQLKRPGNMSRLDRKGNELGLSKLFGQGAQNTTDIYALGWELEFQWSWHEVDVQ